MAELKLKHRTDPSHALTFEDVEGIIRRAAITLCNLPNPPGTTISGSGTWWPDIIRSLWERMHGEPERLHIIPTARQITHMEIVLYEWMPLILNPFARRIVWVRLSGCALERGRPISFRRIAEEISRPGMYITHEQCRIEYRDAINQLRIQLIFGCHKKFKKKI